MTTESLITKLEKNRRNGASEVLGNLDDELWCAGYDEGINSAVAIIRQWAQEPGTKKAVGNAAIDAYNDESVTARAGHSFIAKCVGEAALAVIGAPEKSHLQPLNTSPERVQESVNVGRAAPEVTKKDEAIAKNCKHWKNGFCELCGAQSQFMEVAGTFHCPYFTERT